MNIAQNVGNISKVVSSNFADPFNGSLDYEKLMLYKDLCPYEEFETQFYDFKYQYFIPRYTLKHIVDKLTSGYSLNYPEKNWVFKNKSFINSMKDKNFMDNDNDNFMYNEDILTHILGY